MEYLAYIDPFTISIFYLIALLLFLITLVYLASEGFRIFLSEILEIRKNKRR